MALAADHTFAPESLRTEERGPLTAIIGGSVVVLNLTDEDARLEGVQRSLAGLAVVDRIRRAIVDYREARTTASLVRGVWRAVPRSVWRR